MKRTLFALLFLLAALLPAARAQEDPSQVLVVYRSNCGDYDKDGQGDSEEIARYYAVRRGIPADHLLGIHVELPDGADPYNKFLAWPYDDFYKRLVRPLQAKLTALGRLNIRYIVTTFGMPIRLNMAGKQVVSADVALGTPFRITDDGLHNLPFYNPFSVLRYTMPRFAAYTAQQKDWVTRPDSVGYLVSRLDGVSAPAIKANIDTAIYADTYTVKGNAYVDTRYGEHPDAELLDWKNHPYYATYADIDKGVALCRLFFQAAHLPVREQNDDEAIGSAKTGGLRFTDGSPAATAPRALLYAGWYNYQQYKDVWDWLPGSVALDFDSASLFAPSVFFASFEGMALFSGASGAVGVFSEPGAAGHPMPDVLMAYYTRGYNFAEAAWLSQPLRPFVGFAIGDPLMNPYGHGRSPDTHIEPPVVTLSKDGGILRAHVEIQGKAEVARAHMVITQKPDDALLPAPTRHDGRYQRAHELGVALPAAVPMYAGISVIDPAGNVARVWRQWKG